MSNTRKLIFYTSLFLSILTAGMISFLTTQSAEATLELTDTVKSTAPVLFPEAADEGMLQQIWNQLQLNNPRRMAHIYQFGVFGVCVASACITFGDRSLYRKGVLLRSLLALAICVAYSLLDQTHKLFVRQGDGSLSGTTMVQIITEMAKEVSAFRNFELIIPSDILYPKGFPYSIILQAVLSSEEFPVLFQQGHYLFQ